MSDPRIEAAARAMMHVTAAYTASDGEEFPVLDMDPDYDDLPIDHTEGTSDDPITREAVLRLAAAAIAAADQIDPLRQPAAGGGK